MIFDIVLVIIFLASAGAVLYLVYTKIPQLVAIPDGVIEERLRENSAKARLFALTFTSFFKEKRYRPVFLELAGKILHRLHIGFMRLDNWTVKVLKKVRANGNGANGNGLNGNGPSYT